MKKALVLLLIFAAGSVLSAQQRYALVIGNNNYNSVRKLNNPVNDATDIAGKLRNLGYQVDLQTNVTNVAMARSITGFIQRLSQNRDNEGFFWFAGHAVQINNENYLLPIDVNSANEVEAVHSSYAVKRLVDSLDQIARNKVNVVVLDACRDNPFVNMPGSFRNVTRGLSVVQNLPSDLLILYSTAAGAVALDGPGQRNSPFAQAFLQSMESNEDIQIVFRTIARETMRLTNNNQRPFNDGSIISLDFYSLNPRRTDPVPDGLEYEVVNGRSVTITEYNGSATTINIPAQIQGLPVTAIRDFAFVDCESLTNITIPSSVMSIGDSAFSGYAAAQGCNNLTSFTVDNRNPSYASIDGVLFDKNIRTLIRYPEGRKQRTYVIPSSVTTIKDSAFYGCSLASVTIPSSVTSIGDRAFYVCISLTNVTIPSSVTSIGDETFAYCNSLTSIAIPSSVTSIGDYTFHSCSSLTSITVDNRNHSYASIDGVLFDKNIRTLIYYPIGRSQSTYVILSSVTSIGDWAFGYCGSLTSITIPSSVTSIGDETFAYCSSLTSVTIPSSVTTIGRLAFDGCRSLTSITLSRRTRVGEDAFPKTARISYRD